MVLGDENSGENTAAMETKCLADDPDCADSTLESNNGKLNKIS